MNVRVLKKYKELVTGIVIALFAVFYLIGSFYIKHSKHVSIGAEFMPRMYGGILLLLAACQMYQGILEVKRIADTQKEKDKGEEKDTKNAVLTFALIVAYLAVMEILGFIVSSILFLIIMSIVLAPLNTRHNYVATVIYSIVLPFSTYLLFRNIMHLSLPVGMIFGK